MKKLLIYNRIIFNVGGWFTKFWMITMPMFVLYGIFGDTNIGDGVYYSLWKARETSWPMIAFFGLFLVLYPFRNYYEVNRILKASKKDLKVAHDYKSVLDMYKSLK